MLEIRNGSILLLHRIRWLFLRAVWYVSDCVENIELENVNSQFYSGCSNRLLDLLTRYMYLACVYRRHRSFLEARLVSLSLSGECIGIWKLHRNPSENMDHPN